MKKLWQEPLMLDINIEDTEAFGFGNCGECDFSASSGQTGNGCNGFGHDHHSDFIKKMMERLSNR